MPSEKISSSVPAVYKYSCPCGNWFEAASGDWDGGWSQLVLWGETDEFFCSLNCLADWLNERQAPGG